MRQLRLFAIFYFVQGAIQAYLSNFQKPYLVDSAVSLEKIALLSSIMLVPFSVKIIFAWISDNFLFLGDHRKSYMLLGLFIALCSYFTLGFIHPGENFNLFLIILFLSAFGMSLFDSCVDGLGVDLSLHNQEGQIQSSMMFGRGIGYILLSFIFGMLATYSGYSSLFFSLGTLISAVFIYTYLYCPQRPLTSRGKNHPDWQNAKNYLKNNGRNFFTLLLIGLIYSITLYGIDGITTLYAKLHLQMQEKQLGYLGSLQGVGTIVGALLSFFCITKYGIKTTTYLIIFLVSLCAVFLSQTNSVNHLFGIVLLWGVVWAIQEAVYLTLSTKIAHGPYGATIFAALMMSSNIGVSLGEGFATQMVAWLTIGPTIAYLAMAHLFLIPIFCLYFKIQKI